MKSETIHSNSISAALSPPGRRLLAPIALLLAALALTFALPATVAAHLPPLEPPPVVRTLIPVASGASERIGIHVGFLPYRLGASTTIAFGFQIESPKHTVPQPLIGIDLALPQGLRTGPTKLGIQTCDESTIFDAGIDGCPPDSLVGRGTAIATVPIGPEVIHEQVQIALASTASRSGHLEILYGAEGLTPVFAVLTFRGEILEGKPPYGEEISTFIPPIETLPEAPYASVIAMHSTIGPQNLTYYRRLHGRRVAYRPRGVQLPRRCPRRGFRFAATFTFLDEATKTLHATISCPDANRPRAHRRGA
jgi:hypothetical protein